ncbi:hypothetical protein [Glycomyces tenuis]|uniref:hypothetical protein n=1 Tax=Glycomyces tenuis TaxID=58116 RepID=UPI00040A340C|nr:hypothetical protein [Glycomyces tenuis]
MGRYTDFTLYSERWGGYSDRSEPFGLPRLAWFVASSDGAARCLVQSESMDAMTISWSAAWQRVPLELLAPVPGLLAEAGAFGVPRPLVEDTGDGDYLDVWQLTGVHEDRPFRLAVERTVPGSAWTPLGRRLAVAIDSLCTYEASP